jgi:hypothetical protein
MYKLHHRLWIAISVSTLAIVSSNPVLAKPQPKVFISSAIGSKLTVTNNYISPPPVEAILESLKRKPSTPVKKIGTTPKRQSVNRKSISKTTHSIGIKKVGSHITADRSFDGIAEIVNSKQANSYDNFSAVNRLVE